MDQSVESFQFRDLIRYKYSKIKNKVGSAIFVNMNRYLIFIVLNILSHKIIFIPSLQSLQ